MTVYDFISWMIWMQFMGLTCGILFSILKDWWIHGF